MGCGAQRRLHRLRRHDVAGAADLGPVGRGDRRVSGCAEGEAGGLSGERGDAGVAAGSEPEEGGGGVG